MKFILVPNAIQIVGDNGNPWIDGNGKAEEPWSFYFYLKTIVLPDPAMGTGFDAWKAYGDLNSAFKTSQVGEWVPVDEAQWEMLYTVIKTPKAAYAGGVVLHQLLPFMQSVLDAKDHKPDSLT